MKHPQNVNSPPAERKVFYQKDHIARKPVSQNRLGKEVSAEMSVATINNQSVSVELHQLDDQIKSMMEHTGKSIMVGKRKQKTLVCKVCGKEGQLANIMQHIEANHITGVTHTCDICSKTTRSRHALRLHKSREHNA